ncbi:MAG: class I SAM-dependent methyltransferase [Thermodesulfobacteriota bacterium]
MTAINLINSIIFPIKLIIPQPVIRKIPGLTTNEDIRIDEVIRLMRGYSLDIGCGPNHLIAEYKKRGGTGVGVDVYDWGAQDLLVKDTADLPYDDGTFDTVTMVACLNHIPNRKEVLIETRRILKPDGCLVFTNLSPLISQIWHKYAFWDEDQHDRGMKEGEVYGFTGSQLRELLGETGFEIKEAHSFSWGLNKIYRCSIKEG